VKSKLHLKRVKEIIEEVGNEDELETFIQEAEPILKKEPVPKSKNKKKKKKGAQAQQQQEPSKDQVQQ
jgi:hypothetical protein